MRGCREWAGVRARAADEGGAGGDEPPRDHQRAEHAPRRRHPLDEQHCRHSKQYISEYEDPEEFYPSGYDEYTKPDYRGDFDGYPGEVVYLDEEGKGGEKVTSATMEPAPMASAQQDAVRV